MTTGAQRQDGLEPLVGEALDWVIRLTSGTATQADAQMLERWRGQSPAHERAFREAAAFRRAARAGFGPSRRSGRVTGARSGVARALAAPIGRRAMLGGGAIAASAAWLATQPPLGLWPSLADLVADRRTAPGETARLAPRAGISVELGGRTAVSRIDGTRGMRLIDGEMFVAADTAATWPFAVEAAGERFEATRGTLNIAMSSTRLCATCIDGVVERTGGGADRRLMPGDQIIVDHDQSRLTRVDPTAATAWRRGLLIFHQTPLTDAIDAINRYRDGRIVLLRRGIADYPISGLFHVAQVDSAVRQIKALLDLKVTLLPGNIAVLS